MEKSPIRKIRSKKELKETKVTQESEFEEGIEEDLEEEFEEEDDDELLFSEIEKDLKNAEELIKERKNIDESELEKYDNIPFVQKRTKQVRPKPNQTSTAEAQLVRKRINKKVITNKQINRGQTSVAQIQKQKSRLRPQQQDSIDLELSQLEKELEAKEKKPKISLEERTYQELCKKYEWIHEERFGFMYSMPDKKKHKKDFQSWLEDWTKVLFDYAKISRQHILYIKKIVSHKPWSEFTYRNTIIAELAKGLIDQKLAKWWNKNKDALRVYWKSLDEWADIITNWAIENAFMEPIFVSDIRESEEEFANIPEEDLIRIFKIIEKRGRGTFIKLEHNLYAIKIKI
ncbi:MAG: hypothetical protein ACTSU2_07670 [Promethearchaeota archaeon]